MSVASETVMRNRTDATVTIDWAREHLDDPKVRLVEVDFDTGAYDGSRTEYGSLVGAPIETGG